MGIQTKAKIPSGVIKTPTNRVASSTIKNIETRIVGVSLQDGRPISGAKGLRKFELFSPIAKNDWRKVYVLRSSGRRTTVISYLFHKWLFAELNNQENIVFHLLPEVSRDNMIFAALRARSIGYSKTSIRKVLKATSQLFFSRKSPTLERWLGYRSYRLEINLEERYSPATTSKRYSGWKRHHNDQGSLGSSKEDPFYLEPIDEYDYVSLFLNFVKQADFGQSDIIINHIRISL